MSRPRIKIAHLLVLVLASGAAMGALKSPTPLVASAVFTSMLVLLIAAVACAARAREPARTFWLGFALFGWGFGLVSFAPGVKETLSAQLLSTRLIEAYAPREPAELLLTLAANSVHRPTKSSGSVTRLDAATALLTYQELLASTTSGRLTNSPGPDRLFVRIARALAVLAVALAGGIFARLCLAPAVERKGEHSKSEHGGPPA